MQIFCKTL